MKGKYIERLRDMVLDSLRDEDIRVILSQPPRSPSAERRENLRIERR